MEWIFDGIGTELISLILGIIFGVEGHKAYQKSKNKQTQKAGKNSVQMQTNGENSPTGDYVIGNKIVSTGMDELDIRNFTSYSNSRIEDVIEKGNDATRRKWCLELIINQKQDYLIKRCIEKMSNDKEKLNLLRELSERGFTDSEYFRSIIVSLQNGKYILMAIELCIDLKKNDYIELLFAGISNNKYIYDSLLAVHEYNEELFKKLYNNGSCFTNDTYKAKMKEQLEENG